LISDRHNGGWPGKSAPQGQTLLCLLVSVMLPQAVHLIQYGFIRSGDQTLVKPLDAMVPS
jgi:hypothetical protein